MIKYITLLLVGSVFAGMRGHDGYIINATFTGIDTAKIILKAQVKTDITLDIPADTTQMSGGKFVFHGKLATPEAYSITIQSESPVSFSLYLENCAFTITGDINDINSIVVEGGPYQTVMDSLARAKKSLANYRPKDDINKELNDPATTNVRKQELQVLLRELSVQENVIDGDYIKQHPFSRFALTRFIATLGQREVPIATLEEEVSAFTSALPEGKENRLIQHAEKLVSTLQSVQIGMPAPDFSMKDINGNSMKLSDLYKQNKITMIDFWAGWCPPCRQSNPGLVEIYNKYSKKGFGILGVSFDHTKSEWINAIADDKLLWTHVSELTWWDNIAAKLYLVRSIPQSIFVDSNGIIVARRLGHSEIDALLTNLLQ
jgi:Peroxiredoxin